MGEKSSMVDGCGATLRVLRLKDHVGDLFDVTHGHVLALTQGEWSETSLLFLGFYCWKM